MNFLGEFNIYLLTVIHLFLFFSPHTTHTLNAQKQNFNNLLTSKCPIPDTHTHTHTYM